MWWALGIFAVIVVAFVFSRFRTVHQQVQLIEAGRIHLFGTFRLLNAGSDRMFDNKLDERVWRDPYLLGYAQGALGIMTHAYAPRLNTAQKGMVLLRVLEQLVGDNWRAVCSLIEEYHKKGDADFIRGAQHGADVAALISGRAGPALLADPEVQHALREAPGHIELTEAVLGSANKTQYGAAAEVLMARYMEKHAREAGY